jgi:hypothetical protein
MCEVGGMATSDLFSFAFLGALAMCWQQIMAVFARLRALFVVRMTLHGPTADMVVTYLQACGKILNWGDQTARSNTEWVQPKKCFMECAFETAPLQPRLVMVGRLPILYHTPAGSGQLGSSAVAIASELTILTALRGTVDFKQLIWNAIEHSRRVTSRRFSIRSVTGHRRTMVSGNETRAGGPPQAFQDNRASHERQYMHWKQTELGMDRPADPFASLSLCGAALEAQKDFNRWLGLREWYEQRGIPWRRGHLYHGKPGSGKTSLARALAQSADMPVFLYDLSTLDNQQFTHEWLKMQEHTPCMAVIEDIDGTFQGRLNAQADKAGADVLTFDCFLNALGGMQAATGVFVVITTNKPEGLDAALCDISQGATASRPGRIDREFEMSLLPWPQRQEVITRIADSCTPEDITNTDGMAAAQVVEYAMTKALRDTWHDTAVDAAPQTPDSEV